MQVLFVLWCWESKDSFRTFPLSNSFYHCFSICLCTHSVYDLLTAALSLVPHYWLQTLLDYEINWKLFCIATLLVYLFLCLLIQSTFWMSTISSMSLQVNLAKSLSSSSKRQDAVVILNINKITEELICNCTNKNRGAFY